MPLSHPTPIVSPVTFFSDQPQFKGLSIREIHSVLLAEDIRAQNRLAYADIEQSLRPADPNEEPAGTACVIV